VRASMAESSVGLYTGINAVDDSLNYGGNLEVSPPIDFETPAMGLSIAGPAISAHPKAPFGKVILGDTTSRPVNHSFRHFLQSQKVQPVLPVDTSWLGVGHVDEFMIFVKASRTSPDGTGPKGWVMLIAWPDLAIRLLQGAASAAGGASNLFRSKNPGGVTTMLPTHLDRTGVAAADVLLEFGPLTADPYQAARSRQLHPSSSSRLQPWPNARQSSSGRA